MVGTYKCPGCGAPIEFDSSVGKLACSYCGTEVEVDKLNDETDRYESTVEEADEPEVEEYGDFDGYKCSNCGAEIMTDQYTTATSCTYCGSPAIIQNRLSGQLMPQSVIPFKFNKEQAKGMFKSWTAKGKLTPSCFKKEAFIDSIKGIYVPFWLYDYGTHVDMDATCTTVRRERRGDTEYKHTSYYQVRRGMDAQYEKVPADASEKMSDEAMELIEPYDYNELVSFQMPYLSGYSSEKYNFTKEQLNKRAEARARQYAYAACRESITGYSSVSVNHSSVRIKKNKVTYALLPVWSVDYMYKNKRYFFAINGQTGKIVGELPVSKAKMFAWFGGVFASVSAILLIIGGIF